MTRFLDLPEVTLAFDVHGEGEPIALVAGCGEPAAAFHIEMAPALVSAGYQVITLDNRGVAPTSSPLAPYSVDQMVDDLEHLLEHLGLAGVRLAGHSMGGWVAEMLALRRPDLIRAAAFLGSCNPTTSWEMAITTVERDLALLDVDLPPLFYATEILRYLPNSDLQDDATVDLWLSLIGNLEPWANPGRLGQYEACLRWSSNPDRTAHWPLINVPCLIIAFEHDIDSPPARAREAVDRIPNARYAEVAGASHLGPLTHPAEVARHLLEFFSST
jgi:thioesterase CepJ